MQSAIGDTIRNGNGENIAKDVQAGKYIDEFAEKIKKGEVSEASLQDLRIP